MEKYCDNVSSPVEYQEIAENNVEDIDSDDNIDGDSIDGGENEEPITVNGHFSDNESQDLVKDSNCNHSLSQIPPTERKKWPQKPCVYCRKYGTRRDTRYTCSLCNVALCKIPCFNDYHSCN